MPSSEVMHLRIGIEVNPEFKQSPGEYVARCTCGWNMRYRIRAGEMTMRRLREKTAEHLIQHNDK
jgi:hypothetical protein